MANTFVTSSGSGGSAAELQYLVTFQADGFGDVGVFDKFSGGDATAPLTKYRPGGMGPQITYLGLAEYSDVTVTRVYVQQRDHALIASIRALVGNTLGTVTVQPLDPSANPFGSPRTYRGRIASVNDGSADSTSNTPRMWDVMISVEDVSN